MNKTLRAFRSSWNEGILCLSFFSLCGMCANRGMLGYLPKLGIGASAMCVLVISGFFASAISAKQDSHAENKAGIFWNWFLFLAATGLLLVVAFATLGTKM